MSRIAVVGVGSVGGAIGARLCATRWDDVVLCARTPFDGLVVESPEGVLRIRSKVLSTPAGLRPVAWVLLATKAHQTEGAADWLRALCDAGTIVAILQNGVEHEARVAQFANGATLLPVVVECPASRVAPGFVIQRAPAELVVPKTDAGQRVAAMFEGTDVRVTAVEDFVTAKWRKLCLNVAGGAITALTGRPLGVLRRDDVAEVARELIRECVRVGRAEGAHLHDALVEEVVASLIASPPDAGTSMWSDRRAGRRIEADARNGAVARIGERHGIATPLNRALCALLEAIE